MPRTQVVTVRPGDAWYEPLISQIRDDRELRAQMWADAEHEFVEHPDKRWTFACVLRGRGAAGRWEPAAWCASRVEARDGERVLVCSDNYERRGDGRALGLYRDAYQRRHADVVARTRLPALTYLFAQPLGLHEADGWYRTGVHGTSDHGHRWWELRRDPTR